MIISESEMMGYSNLVELYGEETMGRSFLRRQASRAKKAVVKTAKVVARNPATIATGGVSLLAPKSVQRKLNKGAGTFLKYSAAAHTGGLSLLATKSGRNTIGKAARFTQKKVFRPAAHQVANVARNPAVQKLAMTAARAGAAYVTGGSSEAGLRALQAARSKARSLVAPLRAEPTKSFSPTPYKKQRHAAGSGRSGWLRPVPGVDTVTKVAEASTAPETPAKGLPLVPLAIGGAGVLALALIMGKKK